MVFQLINFFILFVALLYATLTDIHTREVPNFVTLGLLAYGTIANFIYLFLFSGIYPALFFLLFVAIVFGICYLFWRLGVFAGGDAKLFAGIFAVIPYQTFSVFSAVDSKIPFVLSLFVLAIFCMLPVGVIRLFSGAFTSRKVLFAIKEYFSQKFVGAVLNIIYIVALFFLFSFFNLPFWAFLFAAILIGLIPKRIRYPISVLLFVSSVIVSLNTTVITMFYAVIFSIVFWLVFKMFTISRSGVLNFSKHPSDLKEGDILAYSLIAEKGKLIPLKFDFLSELKEIFKKNKKQIPFAFKELLKRRKHLYKEIVINNTLACGLTKEEVEQITQNFAGEEIEVKQTVCLVPAIFLAFVVMFVFGDLLWYLINYLM